MQKQKLHMTPEAIIKYLLNLSEDLDTLITCKGSSFEISTTDQHLYEALASIPDKEKISYPRLVKFLEVVDVHHSMTFEREKRHIITPDYADALYKRATELSNGKGNQPGSRKSSSWRKQSKSDGHKAKSNTTKSNTTKYR